MGFRSDWDAAAAAASDPQNQYHEAGVQFFKDANEIMANKNTNTYDLSNKTTPQAPQSYGYERTNALANSAIENRNKNANTVQNDKNKEFQDRYALEFQDMKRRYPTYSDIALADLVLLSEEQKYGQTPYYKWIASTIG